MTDPHDSIRNPVAREARSIAVQRQHDAAIGRHRRLETARNVATVALAIGLGWAVYNNARLADLVGSVPTNYVVLQANGAFVASTNYREVVAVGTQEDQIIASLWLYVVSRDCYGEQSPIRQYYVGQAMADERVARQARDDWALTNPASPQHVYGDHQQTVQCDQVDQPTPVGDGNNTYLFRFTRYVEDGHQTPQSIAQAPVYSVTVRYRTGIYPTDDTTRFWRDRKTINPAGVQVIDYPGARPTGRSLTPRVAQAGARP